MFSSLQQKEHKICLSKHNAPARVIHGSYGQGQTMFCTEVVSIVSMNTLPCIVVKLQARLTFVDRWCWNGCKCFLCSPILYILTPTILHLQSWRSGITTNQKCCLRPGPVKDCSGLFTLDYLDKDSSVTHRTTGKLFNRLYKHTCFMVAF